MCAAFYRFETMAYHPSAGSDVGHCTAALDVYGPALMGSKEESMKIHQPSKSSDRIYQQRPI